MEKVARHYGVEGLLEGILEALRSEGKEPGSLTCADLAPVDEFHIRGREATVELAELAGVEAAMRVLDVGSGLGGSSRFLAATFGCHVTGVDLTPEFCSVASELSRLTGLSDLTEFQCCSATETPYEDGAFDLAWTQHVQMNIEDKAGLYREIARVLRPGGRFVFHDILAGPGGEPYFPVPWAEESSLSFLISPDDLRELLQATGFRVIEWRDTTEIAREWFLAALESRRTGGGSSVGLQLLLGATAPEKFTNVGRALTENRITVFQGLLERV